MIKSLGFIFRLFGLAHCLKRHGALGAIRDIAGVPNWLPTFAASVTFYIPRKQNLPKDNGARLALALVHMGPSYIKAGQTLSTRPDLAGPLAKGLETLQDCLPPFKSDDAVGVIEKDLEGSLDLHFSSFDKEAIAAASIAQVHRATLKDGTPVAVKVLRPGIRQKFAKDLELFYWLARLVDKTVKGQRLKAQQVIETIEKSIHHELDLRLEAAAAEELRATMLHQKNYRIPKVYWNQTSERVLTTEWIDGIKVNDVEALKAKGHDMEKIAKTLVQTFLTQAMTYGFFHSDLHPGNLLVEEDGTIVALDFGIMGRLSKFERRYMAKILYGFYKRDYLWVAELHFDAGYVPETEDLAEFAQALRAIGEPIFDKAIEDISSGELLTQLFATTARFSMETQPQLLQLQRTMVMAEGLALQLFPRSNMFLLSSDALETWVRENLSPEAYVADFLKELPRAVERLPYIIEKLFAEKTAQPQPIKTVEQEGVFKQLLPGVLLSSIVVALFVLLG